MATAFALTHLAEDCTMAAPFRLLAVVLTFSLCEVVHPSSLTAADRPNIVLIIADDMGWEDCRPYGNKQIKTPQLERLAREGMRFENMILTCSSCSPSRSSLITSRFPHSTGAEQLHWPLPKEQVTFVELLRKAGYWTAAAGKWHLGNQVRDRFDVIHDVGTAGFQLPTNPEKTTVKTVVPPDPNPSGAEAWVATLKERPKDKPFFLWLASVDPHRDYAEKVILEPHRPEEVTVPPYLPDNAETRKDLALYYDEISRLDVNIGKVLDEITAQGLADDTVVIFMTDNGRPFPRCKTTLYDSGIKSPFIIRWLGKVRTEATCQSLLSSVDIAPTILAIAGVMPPTQSQGVSFLKVLAEPEARVRTAAFSEHNWHDFEARSRSVRTERYKYIRNEYTDLLNTPPADAVRSLTFQSMRKLRDEGKLKDVQKTCFTKPMPEEELYDIQADPHELKNLASDPKFAREIAELRGVLDAWKKETRDAAPAARTPDEFDRETGEPLPGRKRPRLPTAK
jgi:N-sulfoglucosamine sulfohydrolase